jgi:hypothetical protein
MRRLAAILAATMIVSMTQAAAAERGPPPCVTAVYHAMAGSWGVDDENFNPNYQPVSAWVILTQRDPALMAMLTNGETNVWFLTEHGADWTHDLRNGSYDGLFVATDLISCQEGGDGQPAIIETTIITGGNRTRLRHRIEMTADHMTIQQFNRRDELVSERRMRRYGILAIDPPPAPPGIAPPPRMPVAIDPPPAPPPRQ